jgi:molybdate transport system substrate-binding protein
VAAAFVLMVGVSGCGERHASSQDGRLLVLAAAGGTLAIEDIVRTYEARTGEDVSVVLGSSGDLSAQIRYGAPADVFLSADASFMDGLVESGHIDPASRRVYAAGRLALVVPPGQVLPGSVHALADPGFRFLAIANPQHAPYGRAAREALEGLGLWSELQPRMVLGENVAQSLQFVRTGNADAGLVALSLVRGAPGEALPHSLVDASLHAPLPQVAGITVSSQQALRAGAFLDFVVSPAGQEILARYGFDPSAS